MQPRWRWPCDTAVALLLDATVIRIVFLPSLLVLLGGRAWYLPRWLVWWPHVGVELDRRPVPAPVASGT